MSTQGLPWWSCSLGLEGRSKAKLEVDFQVEILGPGGLGAVLRSRHFRVFCAPSHPCPDPCPISESQGSGGGLETRPWVWPPWGRSLDLTSSVHLRSRKAHELEERPFVVDLYIFWSRSSIGCSLNVSTKLILFLSL